MNKQKAFRLTSPGAKKYRSPPTTEGIAKRKLAMANMARLRAMIYDMLTDDILWFSCSEYTEKQLRHGITGVYKELGYTIRRYIMIRTEYDDIDYDKFKIWRAQ